MAEARRVGVLMAAAACLALAGAAAEEPGRVVFVCEHGSVKSLIAAEWFNRLARERDLDVLGVSRGVEPDPGVPAGVAENLRRDGFDVSGRAPVRLARADVAGAAVVVAIGASSPLLEGLALAPERWDDIPPASKDYAASRDAMRRRIEALVERLAREREERK